jgi:hypothetical protein
MSLSHEYTLNFEPETLNWGYVPALGGGFGGASSA